MCGRGRQIKAEARVAGLQMEVLITEESSANDHFKHLHYSQP